jgi:biopolymer transport protein ExbD
MSMIPLPSMADIAFLLLIFFITSSILEMEKEIPVNLPESRIATSETKTHISLWIDRQGELFFDGKKGSLDNLRSFAQYRVSSNPETKALINADKSIPFEYVHQTMETLRDSGIYSIILISNKKRQ